MRVALRLLVAVAVAALASAPASATPRSSALRLRLETVIHGDISPKSVVATQHGRVLAQNMIYTHTITVYNRRHRLVRTISDVVRLRGRRVHGGPVEAAVTPDGRSAWITNYSMYGPGFDHPGDDVCGPGSGIDASYVYRLDLRRLAIDRVVRVGSVPKFVAVTPDGGRVLVADWCSYDLRVIDAHSGRVAKRLPLGPYPRGIAIDPAGRFAYVALMGGEAIARVDLRTYRVRLIRDVGGAPRQLVMDPAGRYLYATLNADGQVEKLDLRRGGRIVARVATGSAPRSMTIAPDGRSLYVVNYESATVSKLRTRDLRVLQTVDTDEHPIGIAYDGPVHELWVACYSGSIMVFRDAP